MRRAWVFYALAFTWLVWRVKNYQQNKSVK
jgi:hypothetical protein